MNRKLIAMLLVLALMLGLALTGCDSSGDDNTTPGTDGTTNSTLQTDPEPTGTEPQPTETEPQPTEPQGVEVYNGLTDVELDNLPKVTADNFQTQMEAAWNFGWEGNGTLEYNATKTDFAGTAGDSDLIWRLGTVGEEGAVLTDNAGWGVQLWTKGEGNIAYMYNKIDVPENITQFRIWAVGNTSNDWSGSGSIRAVALYKDESGEYVKTVLVPTADTFNGNLTTTWNEETGTVNFSNSIWNIPDVLDGCMLVYDVTPILGRSDVVIVVESIGLGNVYGDEYTEAAEGVGNGEVMPDVVIIKRIMFL